MLEVERTVSDRDVPRGVAFVCSRGVVISVLRDDLGVRDDIVGQRLTELVDRSSH